MEQAEILRQLLKEIEELLNRNITENGDCQFSFIKERVALELARKVLIDGKQDPKWHQKEKAGRDSRLFFSPDLFPCLDWQECLRRAARAYIEEGEKQSKRRLSRKFVSTQVTGMPC